MDRLFAELMQATPETLTDEQLVARLTQDNNLLLAWKDTMDALALGFDYYRADGNYERAERHCNLHNRAHKKVEQYEADIETCLTLQQMRIMVRANGSPFEEDGTEFDEVIGAHEVAYEPTEEGRAALDDAARRA